jgi:hypothetical protein
VLWRNLVLDERRSMAYKIAMPNQRPVDDELVGGYVLCAWCGKELGWVGEETIYTLCRDCVPLASEAIRKRGRPASAAAATTLETEQPALEEHRLPA